jgi:hypothetical protein
MKKSGLLVVGLLLIILFVVSCTSTVPPGSTGSTTQNVWNRVINIISLKDLGVQDPARAIIAFMRILVTLLVFVILFEAARLFLSQNVAIVIAAVLAIMSAIFIPGKILAGIGGAYATIISLILIGIPVAGGLYAIFRIPSTRREYIFIRIVIILILMWILGAVKVHATSLIGA